MSRNKNYRVRDIVTGLYQEADVDKKLMYTDVRWSEKGKSWKDVESLKDHLLRLKEHNIPISPLWEIVEFTSSKQSKETDSYPAVALVT